MYWHSGTLEIQGIDGLTRRELVGRLLEFEDCPRVKFTLPWLNQQSTERLQMLVLAAQLYRLLSGQLGYAQP
jgi:hypothetical protein